MKTKKFDNEGKHIPLEQYYSFHVSYEEDNFESEEKLENALPLIGSICVLFNGLERTVDELICNIISDRSDHMGLLIIKNYSFSQKIELLKTFCLNFLSEDNPKEKKLLKKFNIITKRLNKLNEYRNAVIHGDWENIDKESFIPSKIKFNKGLILEYRLFPEKKLHEIIEMINDVREELCVFGEEYSEI